MTQSEMSYEFDILYNNIMSNAAPGLTEYEKSVFLTQAQEQLIIEIYNGKNNGKSFENSVETTKYLENLVSQKEIDVFERTGGLSTNSYIVSLDSSVLFPTLELVKLNNGSEGYVKPITQDQYVNISRNPFKKENKKRILKLTLADNTIELISIIPILSYVIRYIKRPYPIILSDLLDDSLSINGEKTSKQCELDPIIHRQIITRGAQLAKMVWDGNINITK